MGGVCAARLDAVVWAPDAGSREEAAAWAERLALPLASAEGSDQGVVLEVGPEGLALRLGPGPKVTVASRALTRRRAGGRDLLLRAVGRLAPGAVVVDATRVWAPMPSTSPCTAFACT